MYKPKLISILTVLVGVAAASVPATSFAGTPPSQGLPPARPPDHFCDALPSRRADRQELRPATSWGSGLVQAEPGLTAEWLQLKLARHIAQMRSPAAMPDCAFDVDDVAVRVESGGTGFRADQRARHRHGGRGVASCAAAPHDHHGGNVPTPGFMTGSGSPNDANRIEHPRRPHGAFSPTATAPCSRACSSSSGDPFIDCASRCQERRRRG